MKFYMLPLMAIAAIGVTSLSAFARGSSKSGGGAHADSGSHSAAHYGGPVSGTYHGNFTGTGIGSKVTIAGRTVTFTVDGRKVTVKAAYDKSVSLKYQSPKIVVDLYKESNKKVYAIIADGTHIGDTNITKK